MVVIDTIYSLKIKVNTSKHLIKLPSYKFGISENVVLALKAYSSVTSRAIIVHNISFKTSSNADFKTVKILVICLKMP